MNPPAITIPSDFSDPRFRWVVEYWQSKRRNDRLPGRGDVDPLDFPNLLGSIALIDVDQSGVEIDYRIRLWGTRITEIFGRDHTGRRLEEVAAPGTFEELRKRFDTCVTEHRPVFAFRAITLASPEKVATRRLLLPLAGDGSTVDLLFALVLAKR